MLEFATLLLLTLRFLRLCVKKAGFTQSRQERKEELRAIPKLKSETDHLILTLWNNKFERGDLMFVLFVDFI